MGRFFEKNKNSSLDAILDDFNNALYAAKENSDNTQDLVQMIALVLSKIQNRTERSEIPPSLIEKVTNSLKTNERMVIGTGEGKTLAKMLRAAAKVLLSAEENITYHNLSMLQHDVSAYQPFFNKLGLKFETEGLNLKISSVEPIGLKAKL